MKLLKSYSYTFCTAFILIVGMSGTGFSQGPGQIYYSQWSAGAGFFSTEDGRGFPVTGDINGDGIADFVMPVLDMFHVGIASFVNGQLTFNMQQTEYFNPGELLYRATLLDMNNDGNDDCFMLRDDVGPCCPPLVFYSENLELSNDPVVFPQPSLLPASNMPAHFNSDNIIDTLYAVNGEVTIKDGLTGTAYPVISNGYVQIETLHDFNADGLLDMMFEVIQSASLDTAAVVVLMNQGDFQFEQYETRGRVFADQYGDFDNDGISDIVSPRGPIDFTIRTNLLSDDQAETTIYDFPQFSSGISYFVHDLDSDGFSDILVFENDTSYFCHNKQDQTFEVHAYPFLSRDGLFFAWDSSWGVGNLAVQDGTGRPFLYKASLENGNYQIENLTNFLNPPVLPESGYGYAASVIDIDHDQNPELLFSTYGALVYREWENNSFQFNEYVSNIGLTPEFNFLIDLTSGDYNGDGLLDIAYVSHGLPYKLQVKFAQTDSTFSDPVAIQEYNVVTIRNIFSLDINGDSIDDLGIASDGQVILYEGQPGNQFLEKQIYSGYVENLIFIDPNEDDLLDIAITTGDSTKIFMNNAGDYEFTQDLLGKLPESNQVGSNQLMMFVPGQESVVRYVQLDSLGKSHEVIWEHTVPNFINFRTSYQFDYDRDGHLDVCYNKSEGDDVVAKLIFGKGVTTIAEMTLNDRSVTGTTDLNLDGVDDIIWQIGPQIHIEILDTDITTTTYEQTNSGIKVFPNPTAGNIHLESINGIKFESIKIYNINGVLVSTHAGNALDIGQMPNGIYILRITAENNTTVVKRIMKM